jgi:hypothetical protein
VETPQLAHSACLLGEPGVRLSSPDAALAELPQELEQEWAPQAAAYLPYYPEQALEVLNALSPTEAETEQARFLRAWAEATQSGEGLGSALERVRQDRRERLEAQPWGRRLAYLSPASPDQPRPAERVTARVVQETGVTEVPFRVTRDEARPMLSALPEGRVLLRLELQAQERPFAVAGRRLTIAFTDEYGPVPVEGQWTCDAEGRCTVEAELPVALDLAATGADALTLEDLVVWVSAEE